MEGRLRRPREPQPRRSGHRGQHARPRDAERHRGRLRGGPRCGARLAADLARQARRHPVPRRGADRVPRRADRGRAHRARRARRSPRRAARPGAPSRSCASSPASARSRRATCCPAPPTDTLLYTVREPLGVVCVDHAVELPDRHPRLEDRAGAGLRQHRRLQAGRPYAADRASGSSRRWSRRACRPGVMNLVTGMPADIGDALVRPRGGGRDHVHRLQRCRPGDPGPRRSLAASRSSSSWAARTRRWCSTTPTSTSPPTRRARRVVLHRAEVHRHQPRDRRTPPSPTSSPSAARRGAALRVGDGAGEGVRDRPARLTAAAAARASYIDVAATRAAAAHRRRRRGRRGLVRAADDLRRRAAGLPHRPGGDLRPGARADARRRPRRGAGDRQRVEFGLSASLFTRDLAAALASPARRRSASSTSTPRRRAPSRRRRSAA